MAEGCKNLRHVSLLGSSNLSDEAFKALAGTKKLQKLKIESMLKRIVKLKDKRIKIYGIKIVLGVFRKVAVAEWITSSAFNHLALPSFVVAF